MTETTLAQDLAEMRKLKDKVEKLGRDRDKADAAFKEKQTYLLRRMDVEECKSFRHPTAGYLFTRIEDRVKGQVDDRRQFVRWALESDEGIQEFVDSYIGDDHHQLDAFYEAIMNTELVTYKENGTACNSMAKAHVDDETPLPPGLSFRPDPYIQQLKS